MVRCEVGCVAISVACGVVEVVGGDHVSELVGPHTSLSEYLPDGNAERETFCTSNVVANVGDAVGVDAEQGGGAE